MLSLLAKDFKLIFASGKTGKWRILSYVVTALLAAAFIALETFIISAILRKLKPYLNAPIAFLSIALFVVSVFTVLLCLVQAKKLFFKREDVELLSKYPVRNSGIILSKLIFLFLFHYVTGLMFTYPVIASYAFIFNKAAWFWYVGIFYPVLAFPFECGAALILLYPYKLLGDYLKQHTFIQFLVATVVMFVLSWLYSRILGVFIGLIASNSFDTVLNAQSIEGMISARRFMIPVSWLVDLFFSGNAGGVVGWLCVSVGVFALGVSLCVVSYGYLRSVSFHFRTRPLVKRANKPCGVVFALIKKEFALLFRDSANLFSFTGLLIVQPFLVYLIVSSLNVIFTSGVFSYYIAALPNFLPVMDILLTMLVSLTVYQGANNYIGVEDKNIRMIKILPVNVRLQLAIKVAMPLAFTVTSVLLTVIVLCATGTISWMTMLFAFLLTALMLCVISLVSLYEELHIRRNRPRNYFLSSTLSYVLPVVWAVAMILLSYFGLSIYAVYGIGIALIAACSLPWLIHADRRILRLFEELEVVN